MNRSCQVVNSVKYFEYCIDLVQGSATYGIILEQFYVVSGATKSLHFGRLVKKTLPRGRDSHAHLDSASRGIAFLAFSFTFYLWESNPHSPLQPSSGPPTKFTLPVWPSTQKGYRPLIQYYEHIIYFIKISFSSICIEVSGLNCKRDQQSEKRAWPVAT